MFRIRCVRVGWLCAGNRIFVIPKRSYPFLSSIAAHPLSCCHITTANPLAPPGISEQCFRPINRNTTDSSQQSCLPLHTVIQSYPPCTSVIDCVPTTVSISESSTCMKPYIPHPHIRVLRLGVDMAERARNVTFLGDPRELWEGGTFMFFGSRLESPGL